MNNEIMEETLGVEMTFQEVQAIGDALRGASMVTRQYKLAAKQREIESLPVWRRRRYDVMEYYLRVMIFHARESKLRYDELLEVITENPGIITPRFMEYALDKRALAITNEEWDGIMALLLLG